MEFSQLKKEYPILGEVLNLYDTLDQPLDENDQKENILNLCNNANLLKSNTTGEYKKFCEKLLKNLLQLKGTYNDDFVKRCSSLYVWLYFEITKNNIPNDITKGIFDESNRIIETKPRQSSCPYFNFNEKYREPKELMKLRIFNDNVYTFQSMLKGLIISDECSLKRYVYKCIEIYRAMNSKYCTKGEDTNDENRNSCNIIRQFNSLYMSYIYKNKDILHEFPELSSNANTNIIDGCPSPENTAHSTSGESPQTSTSMKEIVSPALGVMAGIPPFLALIYNFTPVRKFLSFRNKKTSIEFSNLDEEVENSLLIKQFEDTRINSVHPKYNVAYGQI